MGSSVCVANQESFRNELIQVAQGHICITKLPALQKPSPIQSLKFLDDEIGIEKEQSFSIPKQSTSENILANSEIIQLNKLDVKISIEQTLINPSFDDQLEQQNISKEDKSSQFIEGKESCNEVIKHRPILKNKTHGDSNPSSPKNQQKDLQTLGSQRSIKKVTFDKKQRVIYSSFRKLHN